MRERGEREHHQNILAKNYAHWRACQTFQAGYLTSLLLVNGECLHLLWSQLGAQICKLHSQDPKAMSLPKVMTWNLWFWSQSLRNCVSFLSLFLFSIFSPQSWSCTPTGGVRAPNVSELLSISKVQFFSFCLVFFDLLIISLFFYPDVDPTLRIVKLLWVFLYFRLLDFSLVELYAHINSNLDDVSFA